MSIPVTIDPLGTPGRAKRPFPMVRLTSNTSGSTIDGKPLPAGFAIVAPSEGWKTLDGTIETKFSFVSGSFLEIDFGIDVYLVSVRANTRLHATDESNTRYWTIQALVNGVFVDVSEHILLNGQYDQGWKTGKVNGNISARRWRLQRGGANTANLHEIEYEAFFA